VISSAQERESAAGDRERLARATEQAARRAPAGPSVLPARLASDGTLGRLYETALVLFAEHGFHAVSVRDITKAVGMRPSSLYAHVESKQHLLAGLLRAGHEEHRDQLRLELLDTGSEPGEQLAAVTRAHVRVHATYPLLTRVCNRELGALLEEHRQEILTVRVDANQIFLDVIERGQRLGTFSPVDPMLAVAAIGAMGIRVAEWWRPDLGLSVEELEQTYVSFALKLLAP
jgi:AcrR family transcriptional regulator